MNNTYNGWTNRELKMTLIDKLSMADEMLELKYISQSTYEKLIKGLFLIQQDNRNCR